METDIGNPIDYDPTMDSLRDDKNEDSTPIHDDQQQYYFHPQEMMYPQHQHQQFQQPSNTDFLSSVEKSTWIIAFAVFLLGFFMGKTMQPVILRYA